MSEESLFHEALAKPHNEWAVFLDAACAGQPELRAAVEALLAAHEGPASLLDRSPTGLAPADVTSDYQPPGQPGLVVAGRYTLVELIGEGGMGSVWRAKQTEPVKRFVAVKLIKAGMDSKQVLARFEAERQALALMDHPNIANVLDGGLHEHRPFFVMELVKGVPITDFCDARKLTPKERLELFVPVCQAIQHAHHKGIIHRDIKPSNVLIALYDDKSVVKVIDFGVAKVTGGTLTEQTLDTGFGGVVGTPQYMSPEQATFNNLDIDTRSDVYALGVLLYELLTGSPPFSKRDLEKQGLLEMLRVVREEEPPRPSARLSTAEALPSLSANRGTEPKKLTGLLRHELDWIVMKALEKDRTRRYETANGLAADVLRFLSGEAVQAHPPSTAYRLRKFVKRYKGQVLAASVVFLALVAGIVGTTLGLLEAKKQEGEAKRQEGIALAAADEERQAKLREAERAEGEKAAKLEAQQNLQQANANLAFAKKGNDILGSVFTGLDPRKNYGTLGEFSQALKDNLQKAVQELEGSALGDPLTVAQMQNTLGASLYGLGDPTQALILFEKARATRAARLGPDHPDTLKSVNNLAAGYLAAGQLDRALPLYKETLRLITAKLGPDHPDTLISMDNLADGYRSAGKLDLAVPLMEETLKLMKAKLGSDHSDTLTSMNNLAEGYRSAGKLDLAVPLLEETLKLRKAKLGPDHPDTLVSMHNLAGAYLQTRKLDLAVPLLEETLKLRKAKLGPDHPATLLSMNSLALSYRATGKLESALPLLEEALKLQKAKLGLDHPHTLSSMNNLAAAYWSARQLDKSVPLLEETMKLFEKKLGRQHPDTQRTVANLGVNYKDAGRVQESLPLLEEAFQTAETNPALRWVGPVLLDAYEKTGKTAEAAKLVTALLADARKQLPKDSPELAEVLARFGQSLLQAHAFTDAEALLRECLSIREKMHPDAWTTFNTMSTLGGALLGQKKYAAAEPLLLKGYEGMKQREKTIQPQGAIRIPEALDRLIELSTATNKPDEAKKWRAERANYPPAKRPVAPAKK
ncbi:MAG TPA: serine/threonine-protein kinase [Gemmataceae bacterium]|jgi:serine/threonine protein kinase